MELWFSVIVCCAHASHHSGMKVCKLELLMHETVKNLRYTYCCLAAIHARRARQMTDDRQIEHRQNLLVWLPLVHEASGCFRHMLKFVTNLKHFAK